MNNFQYLTSGGIDRMIEFQAYCCETCIYRDENCDDVRCTEGVREWMLREHEEPEEPDSIARVIEDIRATAHEVGWACVYGHGGHTFLTSTKCETCKFNTHEDCSVQMLDDIANRLSKLQGESDEH